MQKLKTCLTIAILTSSLFISGCSKNALPKPDSYLTYTNQEYGLSIDLPPTFKYFESQKSLKEGHTEIRLFVPTKDKSFPNQLIPGYGNPIVFRIYDQESYKKLAAAEKKSYIKLAANGDRIYAISFWNELPQDWKDKWSERLEKELLERININD